MLVAEWSVHWTVMWKVTYWNWYPTSVGNSNKPPCWASTRVNKDVHKRKCVTKKTIKNQKQ